MTSVSAKNIISTISIIYVLNHIATGEILTPTTETTTSTTNKFANRYLAHLFHKYGAHGTMSFEVCD